MWATDMKFKISALLKVVKMIYCTSQISISDPLERCKVSVCQKSLHVTLHVKCGSGVKKLFSLFCQFFLRMMFSSIRWRLECPTLKKLFWKMSIVLKKKIGKLHFIRQKIWNTCKFEKHENGITNRRFWRFNLTTARKTHWNFSH